jgi:hypothetical protein
MVGEDAHIHYKWQTPPNSSQWSEDWGSLGGINFSPRRRISVAQNADGRLEVFIVGKDRKV